MVTPSPWKLQPSNDHLLPLLENWFDSEPGRSILAAETALVEDALNNCFGYNLLQLSVSRKACLFDSCRIQNRYCSHPLGSTDIRSEFDQLPIASDSQDAVILHHAHEFVANPHLVLREIQRVIVPHGRFIIVGFNPWSILGLYAALGRHSRESMWHNHLLSSRRVMDWLSLLGFQAGPIHYAFHRPPIKKHSLFQVPARLSATGWIKSLPGGCCYVISAVKEQAGLIPVRTVWNMPPKHFSGLTVVKPTASKGRHES